MPKSQYDELRKLIRACCDQSASADKAALRASKRSDQVLSAVENLRGRLATLEHLVRGFMRSASGVRPSKNPEK